MSQREVCMPMVWRTAIVCLIVFSLAGCSGPADTSSSSSQKCPAWRVGIGYGNIDWRLDDRLANNPTNETYPPTAQLFDGGFPLDIYYVHFSGFRDGNKSKPLGIELLDSRLEITFFREDDHSPLLAYDMAVGAPGVHNDGQYHWKFEPGVTHRLLAVRLTQPPEVPTPTPLYMEFAWTTNLDGDESTISTANIQAQLQRHYRVCSF